MNSSSTPTPTTSSVEVLHYGANERRAIMLQKLGGKQVLNEAIDKFYNRQMADPELSKFFKHSDIQILKWHQLNFMSVSTHSQTIVQFSFVEKSRRCLFTYIACVFFLFLLFSTNQ